MQRLQRAFDLLHAGEKRHCFLHGQVQYLRDVLAAVINVKRLAIESGDITGLAAHKRRRQEVHFQFDLARTFAFGTAALRTVERKAARRVTPHARLGHLRKQRADVVEEAHVGRRN